MENDTLQWPRTSMEAQEGGIAVGGAEVWGSELWGSILGLFSRVPLIKPLLPLDVGGGGGEEQMKFTPCPRSSYYSMRRLGW